MTRILVAGGTGALGRAVVARLGKTDDRVRILSRQAAPATPSAAEWACADITTGEGLAEALRDVQVVVNCTGDGQRAYETDVLGVRRLAETAAGAGVKHFLHISIVGIDRIPVDYFQHKLSAEAAVRESGVPYSIQRVTQFHTLFDWIMQSARATPEGCVLPTDGAAQFQLIDTRDVAEYLAPVAVGAPAGSLPDVGGPEVLSVEDIARAYFHAHGTTCAKFVAPSDGGFFSAAALEGFRQGLATAPDRRFGTIRWADFLRERYGPARASAGR